MPISVTVTVNLKDTALDPSQWSHLLIVYKHTCKVQSHTCPIEVAISNWWNFTLINALYIYWSINAFFWFLSAAYSQVCPPSRWTCFRGFLRRFWFRWLPSFSLYDAFGMWRWEYTYGVHDVGKCCVADFLKMCYFHNA